MVRTGLAAHISRLMVFIFKQPLEKICPGYPCYLLFLYEKRLSCCLMILFVLAYHAVYYLLLVCLLVCTTLRNANVLIASSHDPKLDRGKYFSSLITTTLSALILASSRKQRTSSYEPLLSFQWYNHVIRTLPPVPLSTSYLSVRS